MTANVRAEELVAYIYSRKVALQNEGGKPSKVVMNMECWRHIHAWHLAMGDDGTGSPHGLYKR